MITSDSITFLTPDDDSSASHELVPLATAPNQIVAELWISALRGQGVSALMDTRDTMSFLGVSNWPIRLIVQQSQLEDATLILQDYQAGDPSEEFDNQ